MFSGGLGNAEENEENRRAGFKKGANERDRAVSESLKKKRGEGIEAVTRHMHIQVCM